MLFCGLDELVYAGIKWLVALTRGSSLEKASARLLLKRAATLPKIECRSPGSRMGDSTYQDAKPQHQPWLILQLY